MPMFVPVRMGKRKKKKINKEEICEDFCFQCKDGGSLRICDYKDCLKAYHPRCVGKDDLFLESEVPWTCSWHFCFICKSSTPKFHCFCCPIAICRCCLYSSEFAVIGRKRGLCNHCLTLAGFIEGTKNPDSHQGKIDFNDKDTYESLFKCYWNMVKKKEGITSIHVRSATEVLHANRNFEDLSDLSGAEESSQGEDDYQPSSSDDHLNDKQRHEMSNKCQRNKGKPSGRRTVNSKKMKFNGWASNLLIDFLDSIGKDTTKEISQHDVTAIIMQYCNEQKLFDPVRKKKVLCDARLKSLLRRKSVQKNRIYNILTPHFTENIEQSENEHEQSENDHEHALEDKDESASIQCKRQRSSSSDMKPQKNEADTCQQGCFASLVAENIRRVYLNRSLVEELWEEPGTFDMKVIGSFVRIKSDPYDYLQKNSHMLVKVTGIKRISRTDKVTEDVLLQVSNMPKDISISQLSNDNFSEEECNDLLQRVNDGRLQRPSIMEFKEKAQSLHKVITKQWIVKELYRLQKLIDQANEKGWRRELYAYIERKQLLETPSEQTRLLNEFPEIIADKTEVEPVDKQYTRKHEEENTHLPESDSGRFSRPLTKDIFSCLNDVADFVEHEQENQGPEHEKLQRHHTVSSRESNDVAVHRAEINKPGITEVQENHFLHNELVLGGQLVPSIPQDQSDSIFPGRLSGTELELIEISEDEEQDDCFKESKKIIEIRDDEEQDNTLELRKKVVEISNEEEKDNIIAMRNKTVDDPSSCLWYCESEHGIKAGPYSMSLLKQWSDTLPSELTFKVWKANQSPTEAISLKDAIHQFSQGGK